jgi:threonine dehydratase
MYTKESILKAYERISSFINKTPIVKSEYLNQLLGHEIIFKAECLQVTGAFKVRGVLNTMLTLKELGKLPKKLVAYSSGNHAKAIAWAGANIAKIPTEVYMHKSTSLSKREAVEAYGANLIITQTRIEAEEKAKYLGTLAEHYFMHPSDNDLVIEGAATLGMESISQLEQNVDAAFLTCGGGALLSGFLIGSRLFGNESAIYGCEPQMANDAARSIKLGSIIGYDESPLTVADGARTLKVSQRTFKYLQKLDGIIEASEEDILYWTAWLNHLLAIPCEPTAALSMASAVNWLKMQKTKKRILVVLSGGNMDKEVLEDLKVSPYLKDLPSL